MPGSRRLDTLRAYVQQRGARTALGRIIALTFAGRVRWYVVRHRLADWRPAPLSDDSLECRPLRATDVPALTAFGRHEAATFRAWLRPDFRCFVVVRGPEVLGYRCLSGQPPAWLQGAVTLEPHQFFIVDIFTAPHVRRTGLLRGLVTATNAAVAADGITETIGVQRLDNAESVGLAARTAGVTRLGTLTRWRLLWRVWFTFSPAPPSADRAVLREAAVTR